MTALALWLLVIGAAVPVLLSSRCRHTDEDGRSLLSWSYDEKRGRLRGFCWSCYRFTKGWKVTR